MATKEELNRIFESALQEEAVATKNPVPAAASVSSAPMPVAERTVASPAAAPAAATASATESAKEMTHVSVNESDPEFGAMLEEREGRLKKRNSRARWAVNLVLLGIFGGTITAFTVSPTLRGKVDRLAVALQEGVEDVKMMGKGTENYDEALQQVGVRGDQIDEATRALGIDPASVDPNDDPNMLAEMNEMAGEDMGLDTRLGKLKKMGKLGQALTGAEGPKTKADFGGAAGAATQ